MTISELKNRVEQLENRMTGLERQLERESVRASIRRGKEQAKQGLGVPARELVAALRSQHNLPTI